MLLNEWEKDNRHVSQAVSLGVHTAILTYHIAGKLYWMWHQNFYSNALLEHYFFEASGKGREKLFSYNLVMRIVPFSLFNFTGGWGRCHAHFLLFMFLVRALVISFLISGAALNVYFMIVIIVLALGKLRSEVKCVKKTLTRHYQVLHWPMESLPQ